MSFKLFWRKTNRGLWLGLALIVALIIFVIVGEVSYNLQKKEIRGVARDYAQALLQLNVVSGELGADGYLSGAQKAEQKAALDRIVKEYWYSGSVDLNARNYELADLSALLDQWQKEVPGKITSVNGKPEEWDVFITRDGPGRVLISLTAENLEVHGEGEAPYEGTGEGVLFPTSAVSERAPVDGNEWSRTCTVSFSLEMIRKNGKWLIAGMNANAGYGYYYNYGLLGMIE